MNIKTFSITTSDSAIINIMVSCLGTYTPEDAGSRCDIITLQLVQALLTWQVEDHGTSCTAWLLDNRLFR